jgi:hypothetical protein
MWSRNGGQFSTTNFTDIKASFTEGYQIIHGAGDSIVDIIEQATGASPNPLPRAGTVYPGTSFVFAKQGAPQQVSPIMTIVTITYEGSIGPNGSQDSPLNQLPDYNFSSKTSESETDEDYDGNPIITANLEPIYGVKRRITDNILTVKRNFLSASIEIANQYLEATNSDPIQIPGFVDTWQPGQALLQSYTCKPVFGDVAYVEVAATIEFRRAYRTTSDKAWYARVRHEGLFERVTVGTEEKIVRAVDSNKEQVTKPVLLDDDGFRITDPNNATWKEFKLYGSLPYSALGLF